MKDLMLPMLRVFDDMKRPGEVDDERVVNMPHAQVLLQGTLSETAGDTFLPLDDVATVRESVDRILQLYSLLASSADRRGVLLYNMVPRCNF